MSSPEDHHEMPLDIVEGYIDVLTRLVAYAEDKNSAEKSYNALALVDWLSTDSSLLAIVKDAKYILDQYETPKPLMVPLHRAWTNGLGQTICEACANCMEANPDEHTPGEMPRVLPNKLTADPRCDLNLSTGCVNFNQQETTDES